MISVSWDLGMGRDKGQIAFEFLVVYSFVIVVFVVLFLLITSERASSLNSQSYSTLQLIAQNIASYIDTAEYAGNGYNATVLLTESIGAVSYNVTVSSTGVVIVSSKLGAEVSDAYAYSNAKNLVINGSLSAKGANGIQLFILNNVGVIRIYNSNGKIFIDQNPTNTSTSLPVSLSARVVAKGLAADFNGINSYAVESTVAPINQLPKFSVTGWFDLVGTPANDIIYSESSSSQGSFALLVNGAGQMRVCAWKTSTTCTVISGEQVQRGQWAFFALTFSGSAGGTGTLNVTLQAKTVKTTSWQEESNAGASYAAIGYSAAKIAGGTDIGSGVPFNGFIADVQIYNTTLTPKNISTLYGGGLTDAPVNTANLTEWYRLAGDTNDYSGDNTDAYANNITYQTVEQVGAFGTSSYGTIAAPMTVFTASNGLFTTGGSRFFANYSLGGGAPGFAFLNSNGARGSVNLTVSEFSGQNGLVSGSSLVAWFPLDSGFGNAVGGFSGIGGSNSVYPIVLSDALTYNGYPKWTTMNRNTTNFLSGNFPGSTTKGWVTYQYENSYNNIVSNNSVTAVAWIDTRGSSAFQGVLGDEQNGGGPGFQLSLTPAGNVILGIDGNGIQSAPPGPIIGNWVMVTAEYQGNGRLADLYVNGTMIAQSVGSTGASAGGLASAGPATAYLYIGDNSSTTAGTTSFNGQISDVQIYSSFLNQSQITTQYRQGITGLPLSGAGLVGWWPLDGSVNDSSIFQNTGTVQDSVGFANLMFTNYSANGAQRYALDFNPVSANTFSGKSSMLSGSHATVVAWVDPTAVQLQATYNPYFDYGTWTCSPGGNSIELGIEQDGVPFFSAWCDDFLNPNGQAANFNSWNFVADVLNGNKVSIFLNGAWSNGTLASTPNILPANIAVGGAGSGTRMFNGSITGLQVYNAALTPQQIEALYAQGMPQSVRVNLSVS
jgi:hypothetical protein